MDENTDTPQITGSVHRHNTKDLYAARITIENLASEDQAISLVNDVIDMLTPPKEIQN